MPWLRGEATGLPGLWTANQQRDASRGWNPPPSGGWRMSTTRQRSRSHNEESAYCGRVSDLVEDVLARAVAELGGG